MWWGYIDCLCNVFCSGFVMGFSLHSLLTG